MMLESIFDMYVNYQNVRTVKNIGFDISIFVSKIIAINSMNNKCKNPFKIEKTIKVLGDIWNNNRHNNDHYQLQLPGW